MAEETKIGKTIAVDKKIIIALVVVAVVIVTAVIVFYKPCGKTEVISNDSPVLGNENATVYVVEFSDFECPFCEAADGVNQQVIDSLKQQDPTWEAPVPNIISNYVNTGKVRLVFRQYPLPIHSHSNDAALAAKCAQEQGKFWEYQQKLFENYNALETADLEKYASDLNLNLTQFNGCLGSKKYEDSVQSDLSAGNCLGVSATPTFFIGSNETNYVKIEGAESFSAFKQAIDSALTTL